MKVAKSTADRSSVFDSERYRFDLICISSPARLFFCLGFSNKKYRTVVDVLRAKRRN